MKFTAEHLWQEIVEAVNLNDLHTSMQEELIRRYAGASYRSDWADDAGDDHENHEYEWITNTIPTLVDSNPRVQLSHPEVPPDDPRISGSQAALNAWITAVNLAETLTELAIDMQFGFAVGMVTLERVPGYDAGPDTMRDERAGKARGLWPVINRLAPRRFFVDPQASRYKAARFMGHIWIEDVEKLKARKGKNGKPLFDAAQLEALGSEHGVDDALERLGMGHAIGRVERGQVAGYELYAPETGMIYTLSWYPGTDKKGQTAFLRPPRRFHGPRSGPYVMLGVSLVPDQIYPLSPLAVTQSLVDEINAHAGQASDDAGCAKQGVVVDGQPEVVRAITTFANASVIAIPNFSGKMQTFKVGGANPENLNYLSLLRERLDRRTGLTEQVRGTTTNATAEEVSRIGAARNLRVRMMQNRFRAGVIELLRVAMDYLWHRAEVRFKFHLPESPEQAQEAGPPRVQLAEYQGGPDEDGQMLAFDPLTITIEPYSMELVDQATLQRNIALTTEMVVNEAEQMVTKPWLRWQEIYADRFNALNVPNAARRYIDFDMLAKAQRLANPVLFGLVPPEMAAAAAGGGGGGGAPMKRPAARAPAGNTDAQTASRDRRSLATK